MFSADLLRKPLTSIIPIMSFMIGSAAVVTHSEKLFTGGARKLKFASKAAVPNSMMKKISTLWLMPTVLTAIKYEVEDK